MPDELSTDANANLHEPKPGAKAADTAPAQPPLPAFEGPKVVQVILTLQAGRDEKGQPCMDFKDLRTNPPNSLSVFEILQSLKFAEAALMSLKYPI
ncbi:MAG: hypothetical protein MUP55_01460 [Candidatus Aenigmarchaeota archaeon]|nr:hypothetical protein [Candidatus Aenigmarchaeota archaeon]